MPFLPTTVGGFLADWVGVVKALAAAGLGVFTCVGARVPGGLPAFTFGGLAVGFWLTGTGVCSGPPGFTGLVEEPVVVPLPFE